MVLSDRDIKTAMEKQQIAINPLFPNSIQAASVDVHLGKHFLVYVRNNITHIDPKKPVKGMMKELTITARRPFILNPGEFALGVLQECVGVDNVHLGRLDGKSSVGRLGTCVHVTASILNPGNNLCMTLELCNLNHTPIKLYWGMPIAQITFEKLSSPCENSYGSSGINNGYSGTKPQPSQYYKNFEPGKNDWMEFVKTLK